LIFQNDTDEDTVSEQVPLHQVKQPLRRQPQQNVPVSRQPPRPIVNLIPESVTNRTPQPVTNKAPPPVPVTTTVAQTNVVRRKTKLVNKQDNLPVASPKPTTQFVPFAKPPVKSSSGKSGQLMHHVCRIILDI